MQAPDMGTPDLIWNQHGAHIDIRKTLVPLHDDADVENCCERTLCYHLYAMSS